MTMLTLKGLVCLTGTFASIHILPWLPKRLHSSRLFPWLSIKFMFRRPTCLLPDIRKLKETHEYTLCRRGEVNVDDWPNDTEEAFNVKQYPRKKDSLLLLALP